MRLMFNITHISDTIIWGIPRQVIYRIQFAHKFGFQTALKHAPNKRRVPKRI